jgi:hypothetical protein
VNYTFVETTEFTRRIGKLGLEADLVELQKKLNKNPKKGDTDPGTGGLRKVRMTDSTRGQGKRFGARVHYGVAELKASRTNSRRVRRRFSRRGCAR